jgi:hypothetical protein
MCSVTWILALLGVIQFCEIAIKVPFLSVLKRSRNYISLALSLVRNRHVSDHWKERMVPFYAMAFTKCSLHFMLLIAACFMPLVVCVGIATLVCPSALNDLTSFLALISLSAYTICHLLLRLRFARG